jgi:hypothetical protein
MIRGLVEQWSASAVLFREASRTSRQWQTYASRCFFSGILLSILLTAIGVVVSDPDFLDPAQMGKYGRVVFVIFAILQVILAIGLAPLIVSTAIIQERTSKQLELIGLTNIGPRSLFAGLVFSRLLLLYTIVLGALPVLALVVQLGGVSVIEIVVVFVHTLVACTILGAMGGVFGLFTQSSTLAILPTTFFALVVFIVVPTGYGMATANPWAISHLSPFMASQAKDWWSLLPVIAYLPVLHLLFEIGGGLFGNLLRGLDIRKAYSRDIWKPMRLLVLGGVLVISLPIVFGAMMANIALQVNNTSNSSSALIGPMEDVILGACATTFLFVWVMGLLYVMTWIFLRIALDITDAFDRILFGRSRTRSRRSGRRLRVWRNPVLWQEAGGGALLRFGAPLWMSWCLALLALVQTGLWIIPGSILFLAGINIMLAIGFTVWWSGERIRKDQRNGVLELLLTTTMPRRKIVSGKMMSGLAISAPLMFTAGILILLGVLQFEFFMNLFQNNRPLEDISWKLAHGLGVWGWSLGFWFFSASVGCYTAVRTANPRTSFVLAATLLCALVAIPAAVGNLLPEDWILPGLARFIAPGVIHSSGFHHLLIATVLAVLMASLLTTKTVRHLGRAIVPLLLLGLFAPEVSAQNLVMGARPLGDGLVEPGQWSAVDVQLRNPGPDTIATVQLQTRNALGHRYEREVNLPSGANKRVRIPYLVASDDKVIVEVTTRDGRKAQSLVPLDRLRSQDVAIGIIGEDPLGITAIFETWEHGVPGPESRLQAGEARRVRTALFNAETLPTSATQLQSFDLLVWPHTQPEELAPEQLDAIILWVAGGGHLLLSFTDTWRSVNESKLQPVLPVKLEALDEQEDWVNAFFAFSFPAPPPTKAPLVRSRLTEGGKGLSMVDESRPLWAISGFGKGSVTVFLADVDVAPFGGSEYRAAFWRELLWLPKPKTFVPVGNERRALSEIYQLLKLNTLDELEEPLVSTKQVRRILADIPGISPWPIRWLLLFSGAYLLLIGPVDYLVLRLLHRQPLTWLTFPSIVIVFSAVALLSAKLTKGSQASGIRLEIIDLIPGTRIATGSTHLSLYATAKSKIKLTSGIPESFISPLPEPNFVNEATTRADQDQMSFHYSAETWTLAYIKTEWTAEIEGGLEVEPTASGWRLTNHFDFPLEEIMLISPEKGDIPQAELLLPGEQVEIRLSGPPNEKATLNGVTRSDPNSREKEPPYRMDKTHLFGLHRESLTLVATVPRPYERITVEGIQPILKSKTYLRVPLEGTHLHAGDKP